MGAITGALIGGFISHWATKQRDHRSRRIRLVGEFSALYSNYEAALIRFQCARIKDGSYVMGEDSRMVLSDLLDVDATAQRLWWEFAEAFREQIVIQNLWEYMRRISLTKQMLMFSEKPDAEFAEGMTWIYVQGRKTIEACSKALKVKVAPKGKSFFLGMAPFGEEALAGYDSPEQPWTKVQEAKANAQLAKMRESAAPPNKAHAAGDA